MNHMNFTRLLIWALIPVFISACAGKSNISGNSDITLDTLSPAVALRGTRVILYGKNFPQESPIVKFGDWRIDTLLSHSSSSIEVLVPDSIEGTVPVRVFSSDLTEYSNVFDFVVQVKPERVRQIYFSSHTISSAVVTKAGKLKIRELREDSHPRGLAIDHKGNNAYWANYFGYLQRYNLDSARHEILAKVGEGVLDVTWDYAFGNAYVCLEDKIIKVNLADTSKREVLFKDRSEPFSLLLSDDGERLYWVEWDALTIYMGSTQGGEVVPFLGTEQGIYGPRSFIIDEENQIVYIADVPAVGDAAIVAYSLLEKRLTRLIDSSTGAGTLITDLVLDKQFGYLYWMNSKGRNHNYLDDGEILRAPLSDFGKREVIVQPINWGHLIAM
jgi:hypothetical protein